MSDPAKMPRLLLTPVQWIVAALVIAVVAGLLFLTRGREVQSESVHMFVPPGATVLGPSGPGFMLRTAGSISNVTMWYANQFSIGFGGTGASFQYRSSGVTPFSRNIQRSGIHRFGKPADGEATTLMIARSGHVFLFHITQHAGESNAVVYAMQVKAASGTRAVRPQLKPYPRTTGSSSSSSGDMNFHTLTAQTNLAGVTDWYSGQLGGSLSENSGNTTPRATASRLAPVAGRPRKEAYWVQVHDQVLTFIYALETGSNTTEVAVATASR